MAEPNQENYTERSFYRDPEHRSRHRLSRRMEAGYAMTPCSEVRWKKHPVFWCIRTLVKLLFAVKLRRHEIWWVCINVSGEYSASIFGVDVKTGEMDAEKHYMDLHC